VLRWLAAKWRSRPEVLGVVRHNDQARHEGRYVRRDGDCGDVDHILIGGASKMPPRPFLQGAVHHKKEEIEAAIGHTVIKVLTS
jgi:hypothetical protein